MMTVARIVIKKNNDSKQTKERKKPIHTGMPALLIELVHQRNQRAYK